jgi:DNA-binding transcriptional MerR regulator
MRIGELSARTGVSVRALRHYEQEGLLVPERRGNGYRDYGEGTERLVRQIRGMIERGLPARLVREVLPYPDGPGDLMPRVPCSYLLEQVAGQRDQLDRRIASLVRNRDALDAYLGAAEKRLTVTPA